MSPLSRPHMETQRRGHQWRDPRTDGEDDVSDKRFDVDKNQNGKEI